MDKPRLCIDIDNVIARTDEVIRRLIADYTNGRVELRYEDVVEYEYWRCKDENGRSITNEEWEEIHKLVSTPRYLWQIELYEGVRDHLRKLAAEFELHLATSRLPAARRTTVEWLDQYALAEHDLHFLKRGRKHASLAGFHAAVEDDYDQARGFAESGTKCFVLAHPWNRHKPRLAGLEWVNGWDELLRVLLPSME